MKKYIPKEKLSKKAKRELNKKARRTWNGVSPVTRKPTSKKKYNRKKLQRFDSTDFGAFCLLQGAERLYF